MAARHWLFKSDPDTFAFGDLARSPNRTTCWDGVRNYQARNLIRDEVREGDGVLFYHSQADPKAVVGTATVVRAGYPDPSQFDRRSIHHDPRASRDAPRWYAVDIRRDEAFASPVTLETLRTAPGLRGMVLLQRGSRLSIQPVTREEWAIVLKLGRGR